MIPKLLLFLALAFGSITVCACSCTGNYISLQETLCRMDTSGGVALEMLMLSRNTERNEATFRVVNTLLGELDYSVITLSGRTSCAWYIGPRDLPGRRYLYLAGNEELEDGQGSLFTCSYWSNIYRMNDFGTEVEYPGQRNGNRTELYYQDARAELKDPGCAFGSPPRPLNPLRVLGLTNNPGNGLTLITSTSDSFPEVTSVEVFDLSGKRRMLMEPEMISNQQPIDLGHLTVGVYLVVFRQGPFRKAVRYLKS